MDPDEPQDSTRVVPVQGGSSQTIEGDQETGFEQLTCLASTGDTYNTTLPPKPSAANSRIFPGDGGESNLFRDAQFSGDGSVIITQNEDHKLRSFLLPHNLYEKEHRPHKLTAFTTYSSPSNLLSYAIHPQFQNDVPESNLVLIASVDVPITLRYAWDFNTTAMSYNLVSSTTENLYKVYSSTFNPLGDCFVAGSTNMVAVFDVNTSSEPLLVHRAPNSRNKSGHAKLGCRGNVSAMSIAGPGDVLAVGTTLRDISLLDNEGRGTCVSTFNVSEPTGDDVAMQGSGIMKLQWSPCGTYLIVAERQSDIIQIYDVRNVGQRVSYLTGRNALTSQRLGIDTIETESGGYSVWAGGMDGCMRMWSNPGSTYGEQTPDFEQKLHNDPISGAMWIPQHHSCLATCSGQRIRSDPADDEDDDPALDNTLKIWSM